ncbi:MAG: hypothetical protein Q9P14_16305 [candidate division KSB1 bacterium]|nr:hypothetical protein [candidate division KSB1 bacterium]
MTKHAATSIRATIRRGDIPAVRRSSIAAAGSRNDNFKYRNCCYGCFVTIFGKFSVSHPLSRGAERRRDLILIYKEIAVRQQSDRRTRLAAAARDDGQDFIKREQLNSYLFSALTH